jgi:hypothetical protein
MAPFSAASLGPRQGPMSIDEIIREAEIVLGGYTTATPLQSWLRAANAIQKQARAFPHPHGETD